MRASSSAQIWGISGRGFLVFYIIAAAALLITALLHRRLRFTGPRTLRDRYLPPEIAAFLTGGTAGAIHAALAELRVAGAVGVRSDGALCTDAPAGAWTPLEHAVHRAARRGIPARKLISDDDVARNLHRLRRQVNSLGLIPTTGQRRMAQALLLLTFALVGFGIARVIAGLVTGTGWTALAATMLLHVICVVFLLGPAIPWTTRTAENALRSLYSAYPRSYHDGPFVPGEAARGVALYGPATLWHLDPGFAELAGIPQHERTKPSDSDSGSGSGSTGSGTGYGSCGSACGGGAGCGTGSTCGGGGGGGGGN